MKMWKQDNVPNELVALGQVVKKQSFTSVCSLMVAAFDKELYEIDKTEKN